MYKKSVLPIVDGEISKGKASKIYHQVGGVSSEITRLLTNLRDFDQRKSKKPIKTGIHPDHHDSVLPGREPCIGPGRA
jgi:hypothetical protein